MTLSRSQIAWLNRLTNLPTAPGREEAVVGWVEAWARRRGLRTRRDRAGNLVVATGVRSRRPPVVAVAHLDHPALVVTAASHQQITAELRGGVLAPYVRAARVEGDAGTGRVTAYEESSQAVTISWNTKRVPLPGDILRWRFPTSSLGTSDGVLRAPACDDLAGVAAALTALDRARLLGLHHFSVLLTRAEEVGFVGAIAACQLGTVAPSSRILSIECSRASTDAPLGRGAIVRVGDASSVFDADLSNRLSDIARTLKIPHQRKLMTGGSCEATAFAALGWQATGLCLALGNYHNMVDIDGVTAGRRRPRLAPEEISLADYRGLIELLLAAAAEITSTKSDLPRRLAANYRRHRDILT
ncbi:MAG TPA: hypothetical protein VJR05_02050 [Acidimicrobiia bacterium]|nr:hypothetical protein [Acidimicrobiia bacterium]